MTLRSLVGGITIALLLAASDAAAQDVERRAVMIEVVPCGEATFDTLALVGHVRIELAGEGIADVRAAPVDGSRDEAMAWVRVRVPCTEERAYVVRVEDLVLQKVTERRVLLETLGDDGELRALALGIAELLRASWAELLVRESAPPDTLPVLEAWTVRAWARGAELSPPSGEREVAVVEPPEVPVAPPPRLRVNTMASVLVRAFPGASSAPLGGRLSLQLPVLDALLVRIDAEVVYGTSLDRLGRIELGLAGGGLSMAYAALWERAQLEIGARVGVDGAWATGTASDPGATGGSGAGVVVIATGTAALHVAVDDVLVLGGAPVGLETRVGAVPVGGAVGAVLAGWVGIGIAP